MINLYCAKKKKTIQKKKYKNKQKTQAHSAIRANKMRKKLYKKKNKVKKNYSTKLIIKEKFFIFIFKPTQCTSVFISIGTGFHI